MGVLTALIAAVQAWRAQRAGTANAGKIAEVHVLVNGQRQALTDELAALKAEVAALKAPPPPLKPLGRN